MARTGLAKQPLDGETLRLRLLQQVAPDVLSLPTPTFLPLGASPPAPPSAASTLPADLANVGVNHGRNGAAAAVPAHAAEVEDEEKRTFQEEEDDDERGEDSLQGPAFNEAWCPTQTQNRNQSLIQAGSGSGLGLGTFNISGASTSTGEYEEYLADLDEWREWKRTGKSVGSYHCPQPVPPRPAAVSVQGPPPGSFHLISAPRSSAHGQASPMYPPGRHNAPSSTSNVTNGGYPMGPMSYQTHASWCQGYKDGLFDQQHQQHQPYHQRTGFPCASAYMNPYTSEGWAQNDKMYSCPEDYPCKESLGLECPPPMYFPASAASGPPSCPPSGPPTLPPGVLPVMSDTSAQAAAAVPDVGLGLALPPAKKVSKSAKKKQKAKAKAALNLANAESAEEAAAAEPADHPDASCPGEEASTLKKAAAKGKETEEVNKKKQEQEEPDLPPSQLTTPTATTTLVSEESLQPMVEPPMPCFVRAPPSNPSRHVLPPGPVPPADLPSVGSAKHFKRECKPCAFVYKDDGCKTSFDCEFCHLCPPMEKRRRKQEKQAQKRAIQRRAEQQLPTPAPAPAQALAQAVVTAPDARELCKPFL